MQAVRATLAARADDLGSVCPQAWVDLALCDVAAGAGDILGYTQKAVQEVEQQQRSTSEFLILRTIEAALLRYDAASRECARQLPLRHQRLVTQ